MTNKEVKRLHAFYTKLSEGKFEERDFDRTYGHGGSMQMGEMSPQRKQLIISDALKNIKDIERKHPDLFKKKDNVLDKIAEQKKAKK